MYRYRLALFGFIFILGFSFVSVAQNETLGRKLLFAADSGNITQVRIALLEGAPVDSRSIDGVTSLMYASANGHVDVVDLLIEMGADVNLLPYDSKYSALLAAVENGYVEVAELLIRNGAKMNYTNESGAGLLHIASGSLVWEMVDLLVYYDYPTEVLDEDKKTPLFYAAFFGIDENVRVLLENGANVNHLDGDGNTALHIASVRGNYESVKELTEKMSDVNVKNNKGFTPLDLAAMRGNDSIVMFFLDKKASINDSIQRGFNTLTLARKSGNVKLVKELKSRGAKPSFSPYFNSVNAGMFILSNSEDLFFGGVFGVHEDKLNLDVDFRIATRMTNYQRLYLKEQGYYELYWEDRSIAGVGLSKTFDILKPKSGWKYGIDLGVYQFISWSSVAGRSMKPAPDFLQSYRAGLSLNYNAVRFGVHYEYMNFPILDYPHNRVNFELKFYLRFKNDLYYNVLI